MAGIAGTTRTTTRTARRCALITGAGGQDGTLLGALLVAKGYEVHGLSRGGVSGAGSRVKMHRGDATDSGLLERLLTERPFDEVYHLAAPSSVGVSFDQPVATAEAIVLGTARLLEVLRQIRFRGRMFHASSGEVFGGIARGACTEETRFHPRSPYACAKAAAHALVVNYREAHGLFASNGILFPHESPLRSTSFVTRKVVRAARRIAAGRERTVTLGDLSVIRDWGYAGDTVDAMWRILRADLPGDFVVATGRCHALEEFVDAAFSRCGLSWERHVRTDPALRRPADPPRSCGNPARIRRELGWRPGTTFRELVDLMVDAEPIPGAVP